MAQFSLWDEPLDFSQYADSLPTLQGLPEGSGTPGAPPAIGYSGGSAGAGAPGPYSSPAPGYGPGGLPGVGEFIPSAPPVDSKYLAEIDEMRAVAAKRAKSIWQGRDQAMNQWERLTQMREELTNPNSQRNAYSAQVRNQELGLKMSFMKQVMEQASKIADLDPDEQQAQIAMLKPMYERMAKTVGVEIPAQFLEAATTRKGVADSLRTMLDEFPAERREALVQAGRKLKAKEIEPFVAKELQRYEQEVAGQMLPKLAQLVKQIRANKGLPADTPVDLGDVMEEIAKTPEYQNSPIVQRLTHSLPARDEKVLAQLGIMSSSAIIEKQKKMGEGATGTLADMDKKTLEQLVGTSTTAEFVQADKGFIEFSKQHPELLPNQVWNRLPAPERGRIIEAARQESMQEKLTQAKNVGLGVELEKRNAPLPQKDRSQLVMLGPLEQGQWVQPPAGISANVANSSAGVGYADDEQRKRFTAIAPAQGSLNRLHAMSGQLVTAKTPWEAAKQGFRLSKEALTKENPVATAYQDSAKALTSNLSRAFGEKGVLTDNDRAVMVRALTNFWDTTATRQLKHAVMSEILDLSRKAVISEITGKPIDTQSQLDGLMKRLKTADNKAVLDTVQPGQQAIRRYDAATEQWQYAFGPAKPLTEKDTKQGWEIVR